MATLVCLKHVKFNGKYYAPGVPCPEVMEKDEVARLKEEKAIVTEREFAKFFDRRRSAYQAVRRE